MGKSGNEFYSTGRKERKYNAGFNENVIKADERF